MDLAAAFGIRPEPGPEHPEPSYNVAPTDPVPAVLARLGTPGGRPEFELRAPRWGLMPRWATDLRGAARRINARVETVAQRPAYRAALASRRCLLPADGYYEWTAGPGGTKQPYFLHSRNGRFIAFAGLYERWRTPAGDLLWTATILTTAATGPLAALHDRTPMVVPPADWSGWLDSARTDPAGALTLPIAATDIVEAHPVDSRVGNVREVGPGLIEPLTGATEYRLSDR